MGQGRAGMGWLACGASARLGCGWLPGWMEAAPRYPSRQPTLPSPSISQPLPFLPTLPPTSLLSPQAPPVRRCVQLPRPGPAPEAAADLRLPVGGGHARPAVWARAGGAQVRETREARLQADLAWVPGCKGADTVLCRLGSTLCCMRLAEQTAVLCIVPLAPPAGLATATRRWRRRRRWHVRWGPANPPPRRPRSKLRLPRWAW